MLGSIRGKTAWQWTVCGKHPVAKDYFQAGSDAPMLMAFSDWVDKGYQLLNDKRRDSSLMNLWRFWAQGVKKDIVVCGIGKDSSDQIGRPYPIVVMGTGGLAGWKKHWDLLPFALEKIWTQMEYLSSKKYIDFRQLEEDMRIIRPPEPLWSEYAEDRRKRYDSTASPDGAVPWDVLELRRQVSVLTRQPEVIAPIKMDASSDPITPVGLWHTLLKDSAKAIPNAVFIGGVGGQTNLAAFMRALSPNDFVRIWSAGTNGNDSKEAG